MTTRSRKQPRRNEMSVDGVLEAIGRIDLPTMLHRTGVLLRVMRGESSSDIAFDQECAFTFAERVQQLTLETLRQQAGCMMHAGCPCPVCAFAPIQQSNTNTH